MVVKKTDIDKIKEMICKAIDNVPSCADSVDCYTEHSFWSSDVNKNLH